MIFDADISKCFEPIATEPLLNKIPVFKTVTKRGSKIGVVEFGRYSETVLK